VNEHLPEIFRDILNGFAARTPTRCIRATGNHLAAQNDEPEPITFSQIHETAQADAREIVGSLLAG
jgi:hypothetical protein